MARYSKKYTLYNSDYLSIVSHQRHQLRRLSVACTSPKTKQTRATCRLSIHLHLHLLELRMLPVCTLQHILHADACLSSKRHPCEHRDWRKGYSGSSQPIIATLVTLASHASLQPSQLVCTSATTVQVLSSPSFPIATTWYALSFIAPSACVFIV